MGAGAERSSSGERDFCVGGPFDYSTGHVVPTPLWIRRIGFEWLHRFTHHPLTYWRYYVIGIPVLFWFIFRQNITTVIEFCRSLVAVRKSE